jgi:PIN domain nuclease of toxin-antitoxin system
MRQRRKCRYLVVFCWAASCPQNRISSLAALRGVRGPGMAITLHHARIAGEMNIAHKDPFDRLLIAQAEAEDMTLVSNQALFDGFAVKRLW